MSNIQIIGTGSYLPEGIVTNDDLSNIVDTSDEWITARTGISKRRISKGENTVYMACKAGKMALDSSKLCSEDLDLIIVATLTPDNFMPSTACSVQKELKAKNAMCFDISAACSGFVYALEVAYSLMNSTNRKNALIIGAETLSKIVDWNDRGTCILFGDGAGAAVISKKNEKGIVDFSTGSQGELGEFLTSKALPLKNLYVSNDNDKHNSYISMSGKEIFKFAVNSITNVVKELCMKSSWKLEDVDYIIPHQANMRIIEYTSKKLGVPKNKFYTNLKDCGNTSAASIAIALDHINKDGLLRKGSKIILVGFGGGLTYGGVSIYWSI